MDIMSKTSRKAVPVSKAPRITALDRVANLISGATTDEDRRAAVLAAMDLKAGTLTRELQDYVRTHAVLVWSSTVQAEETITQREAKVSEAKTAAEQARAALRESEKARTAALKLAADRQADRARFTHSATSVHKLFSQSELATAWGINKAQVSRIARVGRIAAELGVKDGRKVSALMTAATKQSPVLSAALAEDGATFESVTARLSEDKAVPAPPKVKPSVSAAEEAHEVIARATALLVLLNKAGETVADKGDVTGEFVIRSLGVSLQAYMTRTSKASKAA